ncbi:YhcH/YjgK/YiaL family protein [Mariniphaga anaerophila]|uniref:YhcH/YjgK/YiaL family protein n=1 Tax=Mariniphaga anaerophila TaxID=1484053 RepID=A0A1M4ZRP9_9BACT|nr:YhcH/YjgK/YiaL family protein [Mariniphaga anaerophila]SHF20246.1 YhcH/YjgK/YiaL family protein [Mariniphaga anaerophila]
MKTQLILIFTIGIMVVACNSKSGKNPDGWSDKELGEWFGKGEWKQGWSASPDESVNQKEFARLYFENQERWDKAFRFLSEQNLAELDKGRYELEGADLFVNVDEYVSRNEEDVLFEAHKKYADIQYLVSGQEKIGVLPLDKTTVVTPYDDEKDIMFLTADDENYRIAKPGVFFLFFPDDAHRPTVKAGDNETIRKIVVKVRIN